ncbi:MAG: class I SAM-dependent methyltransferase [Candidatus Omnitrophica bacterium]|nr:class I SAM-dependent methyltransferase [Candidatus Omnitrophota bacterium]
MLNLLDELAIKHGTDKSSLHHNYTEPYFQIFQPLRQKKLKLVEIGVYNGSSLRMWEDFFPNAEIYGIDLDPKAMAHQKGRIKIALGDQNDENFLQRFQKKVGKIDILIDDGSHRPEHQLKSLNCLFPSLLKNGIYVIEDLCSSFLKTYGPSAGLHNSRNTLEYLKSVLDVIHAEKSHGGLLGDEVTEHIKAIHFYPRIAFLFKGKVCKQLPGTKGIDKRKKRGRFLWG